MMDKLQNYIDGEWVDGAQWIERQNPSDLSDCIGVYAQSSSHDVNSAVQAAKIAQMAWAGVSPQERSEILLDIAASILGRQEEIAHILSREEGKTLPESRGEVGFSASVFKYFSGEALRLNGHAGRSIRTGVDVEVLHEPLGVVGMITPWNFPFLMPAWKAAPALAYGNSIILKPSEFTNGSAHILTQIMVDSGLPANVFQLVMGGGPEVGQSLCGHPDVNGISFTGSVPTGNKIAATVSPDKHLQMEMGGKNPLIVMADANLGAAVDAALRGAFHATGQRCTASSKLIVEQSVHDEFVAMLKEKAQALRVGHALSDSTEVGPLVNAAQLAGVERYMEIAKQEGAEFLLGGSRVACETEGHYFAPTILLAPFNAMRINREEIFGPVATVISVASFEEALKVANDTEFGLSASIYTQSLKHAVAFKHGSTAGMVQVNLPTFGGDYHVPFGGRGMSGSGSRELGAYAREFYTTVKTAYTAI